MAGGFLKASCEVPRLPGGALFTGPHKEKLRPSSARPSPPPPAAQPVGHSSHNSPRSALSADSGAAAALDAEDGALALVLLLLFVLL